MNIPNDIVKLIQSKCPNNVDLFTQILFEVSSDMARLEETKKQFEKIEAEYQEARKAVVAARDSVQKSCGHYAISHHTSSVDSSDNYDECLICHATARKLESRAIREDLD